MSEVARTELQRRLASEFESRGWDYDLVTVPAILDELERRGSGDPSRLAAAVSVDFVARNSASRGELADAIAKAIGNRTIMPAERVGVTITINDHSHSINVGPRAQVSGSSLNTGSQIAIQGDSPDNDVLDAVATLVTAGLRGEWNVEAADELGQVIQHRGDIGYEEIRQRTIAVADDAGADSGKANELLTQIAITGLGGALATGIVAGLSALG